MNQSPRVGAEWITEAANIASTEAFEEKAEKWRESDGASGNDFPSLQIRKNASHIWVVRSFFVQSGSRKPVL